MLQRFQRLPGDPTSGSGLGLAIVAAIVERHSGSLALEESHPGEIPPGLAVRISLPA